MTEDQQSKSLCCYHFVKAVTCNAPNKRPHNSYVHNFSHYLEHINQESKFCADDTIVFYSMHGTKSEAKHLALALGSNLYLSKNGFDGFLGVCDKETMLALWNCTHYAKMTQEALQNPQIWELIPL